MEKDNLTMDEYFQIQSIAGSIDNGTASPEEIQAVIEILRRERNKAIARGMKEFMEEDK